MMSLKNIIALLVVAGVIVAAVSFAGGTKVTICHIPPGNPDNPQTITIGESAVDKHIGLHAGDYKGRCRNKISEAEVCSGINDISKAGVTEEAVIQAEDLAYDAQPLLAKYDPKIADTYWNYLTDEQRTAVQTGIVDYYYKAPCGTDGSSFCTLVDSKSGETVDGSTDTSTDLSTGSTSGCDARIDPSCGYDDTGYKSPCRAGDYVERTGYITIDVFGKASSGTLEGSTGTAR
jgi:hypothetical protein